ncbi:hypothetical protein [Ideonella azotifigens]|nr:hypothetical protein [Ideonella azotifigens]
MNTGTPGALMRIKNGGAQARRPAFLLLDLALRADPDAAAAGRDHRQRQVSASQGWPRLRWVCALKA